MPARTKPLRAAPLTSGPGIPAGRRRPLPPPKQKPLPLASPRRILLNRQLAKVVAAKRETVTSCEAEPLLRALVARTTDPADLVTLGAAIARCRPWRPEEPHHLLSRGRGNDESLIRASNIALVCSPCHHQFIGEHPRLAELAGLLLPSWRKDAGAGGEA